MLRLVEMLRPGHVLDVSLHGLGLQNFLLDQLLDFLQRIVSIRGRERYKAVEMRGVVPLVLRRSA